MLCYDSEYVGSTAAAKWSAMPLTLQVSNMFIEMSKARGVLHNVKGAKDLKIGFGLQTPSGKEWACNLVPAHAIERRFHIQSELFSMPELHSTMHWAEIPRAILGTQ